MIRFEEASMVFHDATGQAIAAVDRLNLSVAEGETVCLIGTSGSGKTTALRMVNRLVEPTSGKVQVRGQDVRDLNPIKLRREMGYVIQNGGLFPHMTVERNCGLLCQLEGWSRGRVRSRVRELLQLVNLDPDEFGHRPPHELSGGQRQRVGVARALALDPPIVLMDEPFGALDPITRSQLHQEFEQLKATVRKTVLFVTHDMPEAFKLGDRVAILDRGRLVQVGTQSDFRDRPTSAFVEDFVRDHFEGAESGG